MNKYIIIISIAALFIGLSEASLSGKTPIRRQQPEKVQIRETQDSIVTNEAADKVKQDKKSKKDKDWGDIPEARKRPDKLWVNQVYEDRYYLKLLNNKIDCLDRLELRPDSTFRLTYRQAMATAWCEGRWRQFSKDSIELNCIKNHPAKKEGNIFVEKGIRKAQVKGDRLKMPRNVTEEPDKKKFMVLKKPKS